MDKNFSFRCLKETDVRQLRNWWDALADAPGERARLRRAERPDDILLTEPFFRFLRLMPANWTKPEHLQASAIVAGTLAHVKEHREGSFAGQLAARKKGGDKSVMSELRFQQLQKSRDPDEFFRRLLRAVQMLEKTVNLYSLADSILLWMKEYRWGADRLPNNRLAFIWANDYYGTLS